MNDNNMNSSPVSESGVNLWIYLLGMLSSILALALIYIILNSPLVIHKEVPVEVIREVVIEVPVEAIKEVGAEVEVERSFTVDEQLRLYYGKMYLDSLSVSGDEVLGDIESYQVRVFLTDTIKTYESAVSSKFELALRRNNVPLSKDSSYALDLSIAALKEDAGRFTYVVTANVKDSVYSIRGPKMIEIWVPIWSFYYYGYAGEDVVEEMLLESTEKAAEAVALAYLRVK